MPASAAYCSGIWLWYICIHTRPIYNLNNFCPRSKHSLPAQLINKLYVVSGAAVILN